MEKNLLVVSLIPGRRIVVTPANPIPRQNKTNISDALKTVEAGVITVAEYERQTAHGKMEWWENISSMDVHFISVPCEATPVDPEFLARSIYETMCDLDVFPDWLCEAQTLEISKMIEDRDVDYILLLHDDLPVSDRELSWRSEAGHIIGEAYNGNSRKTKVIVVTSDEKLRAEDWPDSEIAILCQPE